MDSDGVSFGDFGGGGGGSSGGGGGGGGRGAGAKSTAQQDLMDTWYPDCRECSCCKVGKPPRKSTLVPQGSRPRARAAFALRSLNCRVDAHILPQLSLRVGEFSAFRLAR